MFKCFFLILWAAIVALVYSTPANSLRNDLITLEVDTDTGSHRLQFLVDSNFKKMANQFVTQHGMATTFVDPIVTSMNELATFALTRFSKNDAPSHEMKPGISPVIQIDVDVRTANLMKKTPIQPREELFSKESKASRINNINDVAEEIVAEMVVTRSEDNVTLLLKENGGEVGCETINANILVHMDAVKAASSFDKIGELLNDVDKADFVFPLDKFKETPSAVDELKAVPILESVEDTVSAVLSLDKLGEPPLNRLDSVFPEVTSPNDVNLVPSLDNLEKASPNVMEFGSAVNGVKEVSPHNGEPSRTEPKAVRVHEKTFSGRSIFVLAAVVLILAGVYTKVLRLFLYL
jgi:hypothetical protein